MHANHGLNLQMNHQGRATQELLKVQQSLAQLRQQMDEQRQKLTQAEAMERRLKEAIGKWRTQLAKEREHTQKIMSQLKNERATSYTHEMTIRGLQDELKQLRGSAPKRQKRAPPAFADTVLSVSASATAVLPFAYTPGWNPRALSAAASATAVLRPNSEREAKGELFWLACVWQEKNDGASVKIRGQYFVLDSETNRYCMQASADPFDVEPSSIFGFASRVPVGQSEMQTLTDAIKTQRAKDLGVSA